MVIQSIWNINAQRWTSIYYVLTLCYKNERYSPKAIFVITHTKVDGVYQMVRWTPNESVLYIGSSHRITSTLIDFYTICYTWVSFGSSIWAGKLHEIMKFELT